MFNLSKLSRQINFNSLIISLFWNILFSKIVLTGNISVYDSPERYPNATRRSHFKAIVIEAIKPDNWAPPLTTTLKYLVLIYC